MSKRGFLGIKSITGRIISVVLSLMVIMALSIAIPFGVMSYRAELVRLEALEVLMNQDYDKSIRYEVETAHSLTKAIYQKYLDGKFSEEEAKIQAADMVRSLSYNGDGYFWIDKSDGTNVVLLGGDSEGKNRLNLKDAKGFGMIKAMIEVAKGGGGYTEYWFPKKGETESSPKRSYSLYFKPLDWVIGTGNYVDEISAHVDRERAQEMAGLRNLLVWMAMITLGILILAAAAAVAFGRSFSKPIVELAKKSEMLSTGDLSIGFAHNRTDEIGTLQKALSITIEKLKEVIGEVVEGSANVNLASSQMSNAAEHLSQGASQQAASTEEISSSVEEMVSNIMSNTENAKEVEGSTIVIEKGLELLQKTMKINLESMQEIKNKTNIINEIATQTNLLALNAAVEAARAGQYGRGFAVVAAEVRKLSDFTKRAAGEIDALTSTSLHSVEESWKNLTGLLPDVKQTVERVNEISVSSKEQGVGTEQINNAVQELVAITSQNAASSEELASGSEELARQADLLSDTIKFFRLK